MKKLENIKILIIAVLSCVSSFAEKVDNENIQGLKSTVEVEKPYLTSRGAAVGVKINKELAIFRLLCVDESASTMSECNRYEYFLLLANNEIASTSLEISKDDLKNIRILKNALNKKVSSYYPSSDPTRSILEGKIRNIKIPIYDPRWYAAMNKSNFNKWYFSPPRSNTYAHIDGWLKVELVGSNAPSPLAAIVTAPFVIASLPVPLLRDLFITLPQYLSYKSKLRKHLKSIISDDPKMTTTFKFYRKAAESTYME